METSNQKKARLLGEPFGTASGKLRKSIIFTLAQFLDFLNCYRCEQPIETIEEFSIEHKVAWMSAKNPIDAFYNIDNISFSHLHCNISASKIYESKQERKRAQYARWYAKPENRDKFLERKRSWYHKNKLKDS